MDKNACANMKLHVNDSGKERNASLDLLRILCMFLIVLAHAIGHGKVLNVASVNSVNYFLINVLKAFLSVLVNCFVLISGYFLCTREFRLKKALFIWGQALFWSLGLYLVLCLGGVVQFDLKALLKACLPLTQQRYWFITTYLLMYLLVPLLNAAIRAMDQKTHALFLSIFFAVYIALQNLFFWEKFTSVNAYHPLFFAFLYLLAAYFRLYPAKRARKTYLLCYSLNCLFAAAWRIGITWLTVKITGEAKGENIFLSNNSITMVIASACLFRFFEGLNISNKRIRKAVSIVAPLTLGVYLIHDQPEVRSFIWQDLLCPMDFVQSPFLALILFGMAIAVFVFCALAEYLRHRVSTAFKIKEAISNAADAIQNAAVKAIEKVFQIKQL